MKDLLGYDKIQVTIDRIRYFEPEDGYYLAFSGGKDSITLEYLTNLAGVKYDSHFNMTTVDPPELLQFIVKYYNGVHWHRPKKNMWQLVLDHHMPPTRLARFCCSELKESGGIGRLVLTGIRAEESYARSKRQMVELCRTDPRKRYLHPIIDWTEQEVWQFIKDNKMPYCSLYDEGFKRIGCIGCPMISRRSRQTGFNRYPNFYRAWMRCFENLVTTGKTDWHSADEVMTWWGSSLNKEKYNDKGMFT